ncbi:site-specific integrase [Mangrovimonas sp. ST2L15]|uniref:site-specific integrase n=1 Tax=Mangrovimonas sp. ST2L15 TaxID=1645916 RepID=UPI0006B562C2|nr:site-specific integrase [Mangrovimonas sp. ST2L15]
MKINILFIPYIAKSNSKKRCPIKCRITYLKKRKEFSTGIFINPKQWDSKQQVIKPPEPDSDIHNTQLSLIKTKLSRAFLFLQVAGSEFSVEDIYRQYKGVAPKNDMGLMQVYNLHSDRMKKLVGIEIEMVTYNKYVESGNHLKDFIRFKFKLRDIQIKTLKSSFVDQYEYYLKTEKKLQQSTINKAIQRFRRVIRYAISEDYIGKDPFILYKAKRVKKPIVYLSKEQLKTMEETEFGIKRIQQIKDMFVFCCYTGLGFKEMKNLRKKDVINEDGDLWLRIYRGKTKRVYTIPLLPKARVILNIYSVEGEEYIFNNISNVKFNLYLKEIADVVGIDFNLTHHLARKTFATTVLLSNKVPMDVVSRLLGHSKLQTTQDHYGEILKQRLIDEMDKIGGS